jgi:hypothetical protein
VLGGSSRAVGLSKGCLNLESWFFCSAPCDDARRASSVLFDMCILDTPRPSGFSKMDVRCIVIFWYTCTMSDVFCFPCETKRVIRQVLSAEGWLAVVRIQTVVLGFGVDSRTQPLSLPRLLCMGRNDRQKSCVRSFESVTTVRFYTCYSGRDHRRISLPRKRSRFRRFASSGTFSKERIRVSHASP